MKHKASNSESDLRKFLTELESNPYTADLEEDHQPTLYDVLGCRSKWSEADIVHYIKTETDRDRLARWCILYLELDF